MRRDEELMDNGTQGQAGVGISLFDREQEIVINCGMAERYSIYTV